MRYISAYMLAIMGNKHEVTVSDIENILASVGADFEAEKAAEVIKRMEHKDLEELIANGSQYLASVAATSAPAVTSAPAAAATGATEETPKTESKKVEEEKEESDEDMGFGLFD